jgi:Domain of unknown function (DUF6321)
MEKSLITKINIRSLIMAKSAAWTRKEGKNPKGGLNEAGRRSYEKQNPGSNLKPPVKKAEAAKSKKSAARRKSFCARMEGMKKRNTSSKTARDPNSRINKSLRAWDC